MHRPDLTFKPVIKKQQWYFGFNKESGQVIYCGVVKKGNCIEITESLGTDIAVGIKNLSQYEVILQQGKYVVKSKESMDSVEHKIQANKKIENSHVYKINPNTPDNKISFKLDMKKKEWEVQIDDKLSKELENTLDLSQKTILDFYVTKLDDANILDYVLPLNLNELIEQKRLIMKHKSNNTPSLYCRKMHDYSYEVVNE